MLETTFYSLSLLATASFILTAILLAILKYFLPNRFLTSQITERSNHSSDAKQLGGLAIAPTVLLLSLLFSFSSIHTIINNFEILLALILLFLVGVLDDILSLPVLPRLLIQLLAAFLIVTSATHFQSESLFFKSLSILSMPILMVFCIYWVNITNFMDGQDLMLANALGLPLLFLGSFLWFNQSDISTASTLVFLTIGALFAFAILYNKPPAKLFLGDGGSLFLGGVSAFLILIVAFQHSVIIAIIPFLYFWVDATSTILLRLLNRENIFKAHSTHAYQLAFRAGGSVWKIQLKIFCLNLLLITLALAFSFQNSSLIKFTIISSALLLTIGTIMHLRSTVKTSN